MNQLSLSLSSAIFRQNVLSNIRLFLSVFQFLTIRNVSIYRTVNDRLTDKLEILPRMEGSIEAFKIDTCVWRTELSCSHPNSGNMYSWGRLFQMKWTWKIVSVPSQIFSSNRAHSGSKFRTIWSLLSSMLPEVYIWPKNGLIYVFYLFLDERQNIPEADWREI